MRLSIGKNILSYLLTVIILTMIYLWFDKSKLQLLFHVSFFSIIISIILALLNYVFTGIEYYIIRKKYGKSLGLKDILLLPIVGNLWSFLFPFQGNILFTTLLFKQKYAMKVSESFAISVYLYLVTLCFTGLFGLLFTIYNNILLSWLGLLSFVLIINPLILLMSNKILQMVGKTRFNVINKIHAFIGSVILNTNKLWQNIRFTLLIFLINTFRIFLNAIWFYWISISLGFNLSFIAVGLISLIMSVLIIIKITPDNLGISQLITGGFMNLIGVSSEQTMLITLFGSATCMVLIFTIGVYGNYHYFKTVDFGTLLRINR
jgi:hypothetical protein